MWLSIPYSIMISIAFSPCPLPLISIMFISLPVHTYYSLIGPMRTQALSPMFRRNDGPQNSFNHRCKEKTFSLLIVVFALLIHPYLSSPNSECEVSLAFPCWRTHSRHILWCVHIVCSCFVVSGDGLHASDRPIQRHFNMRKPNLVHTSRSGSITMDGWQM